MKQRIPAQRVRQRKASALARRRSVYYIHNTHGRSPAKEDRMELLRNLQPKDWLIAVAAFFAGAIIF
jgi:hypothetical protein